MTKVYECQGQKVALGLRKGDRMKDTSLTVFEGKQIRRYYDENTETWYFSVVDIIQVLIQQPDYQAARNYWKVLKNRLNKEGSETVTKCNRLKMIAEDGKMRLTDTADPETLLRLIQSVPSPKAEPIKRWISVFAGMTTYSCI
jgi:DNA-damage-inducible protein D